MTQPISNHQALWGNQALVNEAIKEQSQAQQTVSKVEESEKARLDAGQEFGAKDSPMTEGLNKSSLEKTLESLNENLKAWSTGIKFEIDDDIGRIVVSIIDNDSGETLRKVPSDAVLKVAKMIVQMQGSSINTKA